MWPFTSKKRDTVAITINPQCMTCCWLNKSDSEKSWGKQKQEIQKDQAQDQKKIEINAYEKTEFKSFEFENAIIFNPTKIGLLINNFIDKNKIKSPLIAIAISGLRVFEKIVTLTTSNPDEQDLMLENLNNTNNTQNISNSKNIKLNYTYLCPAVSDGLNVGFNFYICGITHAQLFQYKLLTQKTGGNLALVTTEMAALIEFYKYSKSEKFSQSQLAIDLTQNDYNLSSFFSQDIISRNSKIKNDLNINLAQESQYLATSLGLFLLGDKIWKK